MKSLNVLILSLVLFLVAGVASASDSWGFHYGRGGHHYDYRHRPYGGHYHHCPPRYDYHYQPYYGYGWQEYRPYCPPRHEYRSRGYYGFYYSR